MKKYLVIACAVLVILYGLLLGNANSLRNEKQRLAHNQEALMEAVSFYKTEAGNSAASVQSLELKKSEMERHNKELTQTIADLNIKLKRVQSAATAATETKVEIRTVARDSIVYVDSSAMKFQTLDWRDAWVSVSGIIHPDSVVDMDIRSVDTLTQIVHRIPKRFLFIKYGTKAIRQEIVSRNPHTKIVCSEYIELK